jgi:hypothetical protein
VIGHYSDKGRFYRVVRPDNQPHSAVKVRTAVPGLTLRCRRRFARLLLVARHCGHSLRQGNVRWLEVVRVVW